MTKIKEFQAPLLGLGLGILGFFGAIYLGWEETTFQPKVPNREEFPFLYFIGIFSHISILTSGFLKTFYRQIDLVFLLASLSFFIFQTFKTKAKFFLLGSVYLFFLFLVKCSLRFYFSEPGLLISLLIELLEIPFLILLYSFVYTYFVNQFSKNQYKWENSVQVFQSHWGKLFIFLFLISAGPEVLPFDEFSIYSFKYGTQRAWEIIVYRNLIFDILFFPLLFGYIFWIITQPNLGFFNSYKSLNNLLKTKRIPMIQTAFFYYLGILGLTALIYLGVELKWILTLIPFWATLTLEKFHKHVVL
jgi:hypothetical protein